MKGASLTLPQMTLPDIPSATSSPASADGASLSDSPDGLTASPPGRAVSRANHTASHPSLMAERKGVAMSAIFGRHSFPSSASAALQQSLANRLQARLTGDGGMKSRWILKARATPLRRQ